MATTDRMRPFPELTDRGRVRRLRTLAQAALRSYDIVVGRLRFVAAETNTTFRVDAADGRSYALRVGASRSDTLVDVDTEVAWLEALRRDTDLPVVRPVRTRAGSPYTTVRVDGVPDERTCVLFEWLPGKVLGDRPTAAAYGELGRVAAGLHEHGRSWTPPAGLRPLVWDRIFYYPGEPVVMFDDAHRAVMTPARRAVFDVVIARAETELARLHRDATAGYLHGDLNPWNALVHRGAVTVFDFEDTMLGQPVQDVAIALFYGRDEPDYDARCAAFRAGYEAVRPWPVEYDGQLELLMAARSIMFVNYVIRTARADGGELSPETYAARVATRLERHLADHPEWPRGGSAVRPPSRHHPHRLR